MLHGHQLAPEGNRIRYNDIRPDLSNLLRRHLIQGQSRGDQQLRGKGFILSHPVRILLILHLKIAPVTSDKMCSSPLYLIPEHFKGKVVDLMSGSGQFLYYRQSRVGMPVGRNTEPCDFHFSSPSLT